MAGLEDIDYMHPDGKPEEMQNVEETSGAEAKVDAKHEHYALQEADGHSMKKPDPFLHPEDTEELSGRRGGAPAPPVENEESR